MTKPCGACSLCGKPLVAIGHERLHGKDHPDWTSRKMHKNVGSLLDATPCNPRRRAVCGQETILLRLFWENLESLPQWCRSTLFCFSECAHTCPGPPHTRAAKKVGLSEKLLDPSMWQSLANTPSPPSVGPSHAKVCHPPTVPAQRALSPPHPFGPPARPRWACTLHDTVHGATWAASPSPPCGTP